MREKRKGKKRNRGVNMTISTGQAKRGEKGRNHEVNVLIPTAHDHEKMCYGANVPIPSARLLSITDSQRR